MREINQNRNLTISMPPYQLVKFLYPTDLSRILY